jgi:hypothetical protein
MALLTDLNFGRAHISLRASSKNQAKQYVREATGWSQQFKQDIYIFYPGNPRPYRIPVLNSELKEKQMTNILLPGIQIAEMQISLPLLQVFSEFLEYPDRKSGLIRLRDDRQIAVSNSSRVLMRDGDLLRAVQRQRSDYWYLPDLELITQRTRQELEPNNPNSFFEFSWRSPGKSESPEWRRYTNQYRLVSDAFGELYQVSNSLGFDVVAPVV